MNDSNNTFMAEAGKAVAAIQKLQWAFYIVVIIATLTIRLKPLVTVVGGVVALIILFFIYVYYIGKLDCPHCERSLRYLWPVLRQVTTCPFCGRKL